MSVTHNHCHHSNARIPVCVWERKKDSKRLSLFTLIHFFQIASFFYDSHWRGWWKVAIMKRHCAGRRQHRAISKIEKPLTSKECSWCELFFSARWPIIVKPSGVPCCVGSWPWHRAHDCNSNVFDSRQTSSAAFLFLFLFSQLCHECNEYSAAKLVMMFCNTLRTFCVPLTYANGAIIVKHVLLIVSRIINQNAIHPTIMPFL